MTIICYAVELAEVAKTSTIARRLVSIGEYHQAAGIPAPTKDPKLQAVWSRIPHEHGTAPEEAEPVSVQLLRALIAKLPTTNRGRRDRALLLLGFAAALRRSELVASDDADVVERREGLVVNVRRSNTDEEAAERRVGVAYGSNPATCLVRTLQAWCQAARIDEGPLFLSFDRRGRLIRDRLHPSRVNRIVQRSVAASRSERSMIQTGHRSVTVARGHIREGSLFWENAAAHVGL